MKKFFSYFCGIVNLNPNKMTNQKLQEAVAKIAEDLPNFHRTAYAIGVSHATVRAYRKKLPKQVTTLNDLLRTVGKELAIVNSTVN